LLVCRLSTSTGFSTHVASYFSSFFLYCSRDHQDLHSFPTRRSSDLTDLEAKGEVGPGAERCPRPHASELSMTALLLRGSFRLKVDRKSTRLNSSHGSISYAVFCLKKKKKLQ